MPNIFNRSEIIVIDSKDALEQAALQYGVLPFFANPVEGFSVQEMAVPGMLFGGFDGYDGCWEWKGPVIREQTTAYGKFFKRKAGFVSRELLPHFLNYRRHAYPVADGSTESMILEMIRQHEGLTSTELRKLILGSARVVHADSSGIPRLKRGSLETPLQRLQMGGWLLIADFEYKITSQGNRYGWGIALYSTPEIWFESNFSLNGISPEESFERLVKDVSHRIPWADPKQIRSFLS